MLPIMLPLTVTLRPSFLALLAYSLHLGPVGGGEQAPRSFFKDFGAKAKLYEYLRWLSHRIGEADPFSRMTARRSAKACATTHDTAKQLLKMGAIK